MKTQCRQPSESERERLLAQASDDLGIDIEQIVRTAAQLAYHTALAEQKLHLAEMLPLTPAKRLDRVRDEVEEVTHWASKLEIIIQWLTSRLMAEHSFIAAGWPYRAIQAAEAAGDRELADRTKRLCQAVAAPPPQKRQRKRRTIRRSIRDACDRTRRRGGVPKRNIPVILNTKGPICR